MEDPKRTWLAPAAAQKVIKIAPYGEGRHDISLAQPSEPARTFETRTLLRYDHALPAIQFRHKECNQVTIDDQGAVVGGVPGGDTSSPSWALRPSPELLSLQPQHQSKTITTMKVTGKRRIGWRAMGKSFPASGR